MPEPPAPPPAPDLAAIEARAAAAAEGPWKARDNRGCRQIMAGKAGDHKQAQWRLEVASTPGLFDDAADRANADFIAAARQDVPALVAYARALEAQLVAYRKLLKQMGEMGEQAVTLAERATAPPPLRLRELAAENARLRARDAAYRLIIERLTAGDPGWLFALAGDADFAAARQTVLEPLP